MYLTKFLEKRSVKSFFSVHHAALQLEPRRLRKFEM